MTRGRRKADLLSLPGYSMVSQSICPDVCAALGSQSCWQKDRAPEGAEISPAASIHQG